MANIDGGSADEEDNAGFATEEADRANPTMSSACVLGGRRRERGRGTATLACTAVQVYTMHASACVGGRFGSFVCVRLRPGVSLCRSACGCWWLSLLCDVECMSQQYRWKWKDFGRGRGEGGGCQFWGVVLHREAHGRVETRLKIILVSKHGGLLRLVLTRWSEQSWEPPITPQSL